MVLEVPVDLVAVAVDIQVLQAQVRDIPVIFQ
jgi:hypothetical protein